MVMWKSLPLSRSQKLHKARGASLWGWRLRYRQIFNIFLKTVKRAPGEVLRTFTSVLKVITLLHLFWFAMPNKNFHITMKSFSYVSIVPER